VACMRAFLSQIDPTLQHCQNLEFQIFNLGSCNAARSDFFICGHWATVGWLFGILKSPTT
jgi:hypothetical protein